MAGKKEEDQEINLETLATSSPFKKEEAKAKKASSKRGAKASKEKEVEDDWEDESDSEDDVESNEPVAYATDSTIARKGGVHPVAAKMSFALENFDFSSFEKSSRKSKK